MIEFGAADIQFWLKSLSDQMFFATWLTASLLAMIVFLRIWRVRFGKVAVTNTRPTAKLSRVTHSTKWVGAFVICFGCATLKPPETISRSVEFPFDHSSVVVADVRPGEAGTACEANEPSLRVVLPGTPLLAHDASGKKILEPTVCELEVSKAGIARWRNLPTTVHDGIRQGKVRDGLSAYPTRMGVSDCNSLGCWSSSPTDARCAVVWNEPGARDSGIANHLCPAVLPAATKVTLLERFPKNNGATTVCELRILGQPAPSIEWRVLPASVVDAIRAGTRTDALRSYVDDDGIVHCSRQGCWSPMKAYERGCGIVCNQEQVCIEQPAAGKSVN